LYFLLRKGAEFVFVYKGTMLEFLLFHAVHSLDTYYKAGRLINESGLKVDQLLVAATGDLAMRIYRSRGICSSVLC
jgi:hypothetical protein